jgi:hypothetical protein
VNVDPELRKRVEQIKSRPVQMYREAGDYSNRELVEGIVVSPDDIAAIEAVARGPRNRLDDAIVTAREIHTGVIPGNLDAALHDLWDAFGATLPTADDVLGILSPDRAEAAHHRMVQPDHYQRWER